MDRYIYKYLCPFLMRETLADHTMLASGHPLPRSAFHSFED